MSPVSSKSTQEFVPIKEIRDGVIILKDNSLRKRLSKNSRIFAEKFSWDKISKKYEKVYFEALNNGV